MGRKKVKIKKVCPICENVFETYPKYEKKTCSKKCMGINQQGEGNPNFNNKWNDEQRKHLSEYQKSISHIISKRVRNDWIGNNERRESAAKTMSETMSGRQTWLGKNHSEESKILIGQKSSEKFTPEFKEQFRQTMENNGHWIPLGNKTDYEIYFKEAEWVNRMFDIIPNGLEMLNEHGTFHALDNSSGIVRDHILGRRYGFDNLIYPEILRHPCNCRILLHKDNVSKAQRGKGRPDSDISISELFEKIESYNGEWFEHKLVLSLIKDYRCGGRWMREAQGGTS